MGQIAIPSSTASSASNTVKYLRVGTSGGTIYMGEVRVFPSDEDIVNMKNKCLTLVAWENTTFTFTPTSGQVLSYSVDGGAYTALPSTGGSVSVSGGQQVSWSGTAVPVVSSATVTEETDWGIGKFSSMGKYHVEGNAMSLLFGSTYKTATSLSGKNYALVGLFGIVFFKSIGLFGKDVDTNKELFTPQKLKELKAIKINYLVYQEY